MPSNRETLPDRPDISWTDWKAELMQIAVAHDMGEINPEDYRDYYDDDYTPEHAWGDDWDYGN